MKQHIIFYTRASGDKIGKTYNSKAHVKDPVIFQFSRARKKSMSDLLHNMGDYVPVSLNSLCGIMCNEGNKYLSTT